MASEILERIACTGTDGIKRAELKRTFGKECDELLRALIENEEVFIEKKGNAYFVWTKENYVLYLSQKDSKFKLALNVAANINTVGIKDHLHNMQETMKNFNQNNGSSNDEFKIEFDKCLAELSTSIGWASFSQIRKKIGESRYLSNEHFYTLTSDLLEKHRENYEISSGGQEGIIVRGLIHGYVRNI